MYDSLILLHHNQAVFIFLAYQVLHVEKLVIITDSETLQLENRRNNLANVLLALLLLLSMPRHISDLVCNGKVSLHYADLCYANVLNTEDIFMCWYAH